MATRRETEKAEGKGDGPVTGGLREACGAVWNCVQDRESVTGQNRENGGPMGRRERRSVGASRRQGNRWRRQARSLLQGIRFWSESYMDHARQLSHQSAVGCLCTDLIYSIVARSARGI